MSIYQGLAHVYDRLMAGVDYEGWARYIKTLAGKYSKDTGSVLDVACGTGNTSISLAQLGWRVTGVDLSLPMLQQARRKAAEAKLEIIFLQQDMRDLELTREYDLATCFQDGLSYLLSSEDLEQAFRSIRKVLGSGGLFIFDLNAEERYSRTARDAMRFIDEEGFSLIYQTNFLPEKEIWETNITGFIREEEKYVKFHEVHQEKQHHLKNVQDSLEASGFHLRDAFETCAQNPPGVDRGKIFVVAEKDEGRE